MLTVSLACKAIKNSHLSPWLILTIGCLSLLIPFTLCEASIMVTNLPSRMIKRIVEVSNPSYLYLKNRQLIIEQAHEVVAQVPIEDIGVLILEHSAITIRLSNNIVQPKLRNSLYHLI
jgi:hypothetical protein